MSDGNFTEMTIDERLLPGPRAFLVSGYGTDALGTLSAFLETLGYTDVPIKPCTSAQIDDTVQSVLESDTAGPPAGEGKLPNVMVFSGVTRQDVQAVMGRFSESGLPRPIFAVATPTSLGFTAKTLLLHLLEEEKAVRAAARKPKTL